MTQPQCRTQLESYLKAWKMEGAEGIGKLLSLQTSDPSNASLYEEMIWLLSSPNQEVGMEQETTPMVNMGDRRAKKSKRRDTEVDVTTLEEEDEEMVVVKPEFDVETYGDDFDDNSISSKRKRRKLSNDPVAGMITPPSTPPEERKAPPPVSHPTPLSEVPDDGRPWYDGCEYQCNFCPLATKHITQVV